MTEYIQMKQSELANWKKKRHLEQNEICPILGIKVPLDKVCVDHCHRTKNQEIGNNNGGLIRGVIHLQANSLEGKISNGFVRYGLHNLGVSLPTFLRNLADYLEFSKTNLIHPSEKPKERKITKNCYNILVKKIKLSNLSSKKKEKIPAYPKSGKLTVILEKLFDKHGIQVQFYAEKKR